METEIVRVNPERPEDNSEGIVLCGKIIRKGGLVAFPTETVYGLGANALDGSAVADIFRAKKRPQDNPLIVHICNFDNLDLVADFTGEEGERQKKMFMKMAEAFWPGPLTMIVNKAAGIPDEVSCGLGTVGIRMPSNKVARALIKESGVPIAAPSANSSGKPSPTKFSHVYDDMFGKIDCIIDGGDSSVGVESTVLDLAGSAEPTILRPGAVTRSDVEAVLGCCAECDWKASEGKVEKPRSPGMKYRHYAPKAPVIMYSGARSPVASRIRSEIIIAKNSGKTVGVLATDETICYYKDADFVKSLGPSDRGLVQAGRLFSLLREFDADCVDIILAEAVSESGVGDAVMNRLFRAAGGRIITVSDKISE